MNSSNVAWRKPAFRAPALKASVAEQSTNFACLHRSFAKAHSWMFRIKRVLPNRTPLPRSDIRLTKIGIGPVGVFGTRRAEIGRQLVLALTLGAGQFCTNPALVLVVDGDGYDDLVAEPAAATC